MKQIVDKLNKIAKKINENVELSDRDLIIDSLDSITKAYGGTPNDSTLIVDKLDDIYNNIAPAVSGNIEITENGENINVAPYATATVNVAGGGDAPPLCTITVVNDTMPEQNRTVNNYISATDMTVQATVQLEPTETVQIIGFYQDMGDNSYTVVIPQASTPLFAYLINSDSTKFSNLDNITLFEMDGTYGPIVTDPTKLSSMTISVEIIDK